MKAIVYHNYGPPDVVKLEDIEKPTAADEEALIKVRAASVNSVHRLYRGRPYLVRINIGLSKPKDMSKTSRVRPSIPRLRVRAANARHHMFLTREAGVSIKPGA